MTWKLSLDICFDLYPKHFSIQCTEGNRQRVVVGRSERGQVSVKKKKKKKVPRENLLNNVSWDVRLGEFGFYLNL